MKIDGYEISERHMLEELRNVVNNNPLFPGDTISHSSAKACSKARWIVRNEDGNWIPTAKGIRTLNRHEDGL